MARSAIALLAAAAPALAQIPEATEGRGIKVGEGLVLHPGVLLDTVYDSNVHYASGNGDDEDIIASPYLRLSGRLDLASLPPQRLGDGKPAVDFRFEAAASYREYLKDDADVRQLRALDLEGGLRATFNPQGLAYFRVVEQFARLKQPRNSDGPFNLTRDRNRAGAELGVRPGGGTIVAAVGYEFNFEFYEEELNFETIGDPPQPSDVGNPDSIWHTVTGTARWRFVPKTALTFDIAYSAYDKDNSPSMSGEPYYNDSTALRTYAGLVGLLTPKVTATLAGGYGRANYDNDADFGGVLAKIALDWRPTGQTRVGLGYERDFADSVAANFYVDNRLYATLEQSIASRWTLSLAPGVRFRRYRAYREQLDRGNVEPSDTRKDTLGELRASLAYSVLPWLLVGGSYSLETDASSWRDGEGEYVKHVVLLRLEAAF